MHPLTKKLFGTASGAMTIDFFAANSVVTGTIVKQTGPAKFVVTDGVTNYTVKLANTPALIANLSAGYGTIKVNTFGSNAVQNAQTIYSKTLRTVQGNSYPWILGASTKVGQAGVQKKA